MGAIRAALVDAVFAALPVALVYFSGWAYLTSYLGQFGIDATQFDVSFTTVLVYAFVPLQSHCVLWMLGGIGALGFLAFLAEIHFSETSKTGKTLTVVLGLAALMMVIPLLFVISHLANTAAKEMADNVWKGDKSQSVMLLSDPKNDEAAVKSYNVCREGRRLRQIIGLPDQMFLICRSAVDPCNRGSLFAVNKDGHIIYVADKVREDIDVQKICTN
ncbi:hypothetical protein SAMN02927914_05855 [Mesorhizobium qingshengii]|uniref:Uncharacterized protein n=1 Tax=Mesorhizobium qingshengii TaxID=1165689 RepID=A0A1G5ZSU6_9HYPH|nr:hypothetical protein SAMN02927914_05855 [Mesorhizobium qingshengii]